MIELNKLYLGDSFEIAEQIDDESVDLILEDMPYNTTACDWDVKIDLERYWKSRLRIIKPNGAIVLTASQPFTTLLINSNRTMFKYCWVWEKSKVGDIFNAKNKPLKKHEDVCVFSLGTTANGSARKMNYHPQGLVSIQKEHKNKETVRAFYAPRPNHKEKYTQTQTGYPTSVLKFANDNGFHPTQKPVDLFEYLIKTYTDENELVFDGFGGSGTTAIACLNSNRNFIVVEQKEDYYYKALNRLNEHQLKLAI